MLHVTKNFNQFYADVQIIYDSYRLLDMGILCCYSIIGGFGRRELDKVLRFCRAYPSYHVVTDCRGYITWNRYHPDGDSFFIAEGNDDPDYVLDCYEEMKRLEPFLLSKLLKK